MEEKANDGDRPPTKKASAGKDNLNAHTVESAASETPASRDPPAAPTAPTATTAVPTTAAPTAAPRSNRPAHLSAEGRPSLETLAGDAGRTHRSWTPKYGRVQKCDWCNCRAEGTLHVCDTCSLRMCEHCARDRIWSTNRTHYIDSAALDWIPKKVSRAAAGAKAKGPAKRPAVSSPSEEPAAPATRRRKLAKDDPRPQDNDDPVDGNASTTGSGPQRGRPLAPANTRPDIAQPLASSASANREAVRRAQAGASQPFPARQHVPLASAPAARTRPDMLRTAAQALLSLNDTSRSSSLRRFANAAEDSEDGDSVLGHDVAQERGNVNEPGRRLGNRAAGNPTARTLGRATPGRTSSPLAAAGAPSPGVRPAVSSEEAERDRLVAIVYREVYGFFPAVDPHRIRTRIPDTNTRPVPAAEFHREPSQHGYGSYSAAQQPGGHHSAYGYGQYHGYGQQYHGEVPAAASHLYYNVPPPAPGYAHQGLYGHPEYARDPNYHQQGGYYPQAPHPANDFHHNERSQAENEHIDNDRRIADEQTANEMRHAWTNSQTLQHLVAENRRVYAIGLLWDVFGLRRTRFYIGNDSHTVRWFMAERDSQSRIENSTRAYHAAQMQQQQQPYPHHHHHHPHHVRHRDNSYPHPQPYDHAHPYPRGYASPQPSNYSHPPRHARGLTQGPAPVADMEIDNLHYDDGGMRDHHSRAASHDARTEDESNGRPAESHHNRAEHEHYDEGADADAEYEEEICSEHSSLEVHPGDRLVYQTTEDEDDDGEYVDEPVDEIDEE